MTGPKMLRQRWRLALGVVLAASCLLAAPQVTGVRFAQREGSDTVDVCYDLASPEGAVSLNVALEVSLDGGANYSLVPEAVAGDVGSGVSPGKQKHVVWAARADVGRLESDEVVMRVRADDGLKAVQPPSPPSTSGTPSGMRYLRRNEQGYDEYLWLKDSSVMVKVPAGEFWMGSPQNEGGSDEHPQHKVSLSEYYLDKHEVTNRQYKRFCDATSHVYPPDPFSSMAQYFGYYPEYPVVNVSWEDAKAYCDWAGKRLPTEAEWEKAARGTDAREYPWGNSEPDAGCTFRANYDPGHFTEDGYEYTAPVGSFAVGASPFGLLDMAGNVWEWCNDWYDAAFYGGGRVTENNPQGPTSASIRVLRGGSWSRIAAGLRCAIRSGFAPSYRDINCGFRCAAPQNVDADQLYNTAYLDFTRGKYDVAISGFRRFIGAFPQNDNADNAQYWIAECFYATGQLDSAGAALREVVVSYPSGNKVPAAEYKLGLVYLAQNRKAEAINQLRKVVKEYPGSNEAKLAQARLQALE